MWQKLGPFIQKYLRQGNIGTNGINRGQCVGLVEVWLDALGKPHIPGNAVDLLANAPAEGYKVTMNDPTNYPVAGDIVCWNGTWGGGYGHTAVVIAANANELLTLEQNDPEGAPVNIGVHDYSGVQGWIALA